MGAGFALTTPSQKGPTLPLQEFTWANQPHHLTRQKVKEAKRSSHKDAGPLVADTLLPTAGPLHHTTPPIVALGHALTRLPVSTTDESASRV